MADQVLTDLFRGMSAQNKELLAGVVLRSPDVLFDSEALIDLGGSVTARLLWLGGAHTRGDELTLVEPDHTLISGDVVQNTTIPNIFGQDGTPTEWLATLNKVAMLNIAHVLPHHSAPADGSLVAAERELIVAIRTSPYSEEPRCLNRCCCERNQRHPENATSRLTGHQRTHLRQKRLPRPRRFPLAHIQEPHLPAPASQVREWVIAQG